MDDFIKGLGKLPPWALVLLGLVFTGAVGSLFIPRETAQQPEPEPVKTETASEPAPEPELTAAELAEFDKVLLNLDPTQRMVTEITQYQDSEILNITVGNDFIRINQIQQGEAAIAMRDALSKICECTPYLKFNTDGGQRLVEIGRGQPKYKN